MKEILLSFQRGSNVVSRPHLLNQKAGSTVNTHNQEGLLGTSEGRLLPRGLQRASHSLTDSLNSFKIPKLQLGAGDIVVNKTESQPQKSSRLSGKIRKHPVYPVLMQDHDG